MFAMQQQCQQLDLHDVSYASAKCKKLDTLMTSSLMLCYDTEH